MKENKNTKKRERRHKITAKNKELKRIMKAKKHNNTRKKYGQGLRN